jgi:hypothetical protein
MIPPAPPAGSPGGVDHDPAAKWISLRPPPKEVYRGEHAERARVEGLAIEHHVVRAPGVPTPIQEVSMRSTERM